MPGKHLRFVLFALSAMIRAFSAACILEGRGNGFFPLDFSTTKFAFHGFALFLT